MKLRECTTHTHTHTRDRHIFGKRLIHAGESAAEDGFVAREIRRTFSWFALTACIPGPTLNGQREEIAKGKQLEKWDQHNQNIQMV